MVFTRNLTKKVKVGNIHIGGCNSVVIQSMTNTKTSNINLTIKQIDDLYKNGCQLVRVAIFDQKDLNALRTICNRVECPIVADIHYNYIFAIKAIEYGVKKIRINPGNLCNKDQLKEIIKVANKYKVAIRIGINSGSLPKNIKQTPSAIVNEAIKWIRFFESNKFTNLVISLKSSDPIITKDTYLLAASKIKYPLHLGVTEAGNLLDASIKSSIGLCELLLKGIGDTIRVSISGNPLNEPIVAKKILNSCNIPQDIPNIISCPTCGRCQYPFDKLLSKITEYVNQHPKKINIAIMGCCVNGIGECTKANIGIYGLSKNKCCLMYKGKKINTFSNMHTLFLAFCKHYNSY